MNLESKTREMIVAHHAVPALEKAVARLTRAAKRLNLSPLPALTVHWNRKTERVQHRESVLLEFGERPVERCLPDVIVEVVPATLTLPDTGSIRAAGKWRLVGWLTKTELGMESSAGRAADLPRLVPYKSTGQYCDHCATKRNRVRTMVIEDTEHGILKQVGCECATHYLTDLQGTLAAIEFQDLVVDVIRIDDSEVWGDYAGSVLRAWETETVLAHCARAVRERHGYAPTRIHDNRTGDSVRNPDSTAEHARRSLSDPEPAKMTPAERIAFDAIETGTIDGRSLTELDAVAYDALLQQWARAKDADEAHAKWAAGQPNPDDFETARAIIAWADTITVDPSKDEFLANLRDLIATGYASERKIGMLATVWPCKARYEREQKIREMEAKRSEPAPSGRLPIEGEVLTKKEHFGDFGPSWKLTIQLDNGCRVWCSEPAALNCKPGDRVRITATWKRSDRDQFFAFGSRPVVTSEKPAKAKRGHRTDMATAEINLTVAA